MTDKLVILEELIARAAIGADRHFRGLIEYAKSELPEAFWSEFPASMEEMGGIFSASSRNVYLTLFDDSKDLVPIYMNFSFSEDHWSLENYTIRLGPFSPVFMARTLPDILLMSRGIVKVQNTAVMAGDAQESPRVQ